jgi:hypothetical protein
MRLRILGSMGLGVIWLAGAPLRRRMLARLVVVVQLGSAHLARRILSLLVGIILPRAIGVVGIVGVRRIAGHLCVKERRRHKRDREDNSIQSGQHSLAVWTVDSRLEERRRRQGAIGS